MKFIHAVLACVCVVFATQSCSTTSSVPTVNPAVLQAEITLLGGFVSPLLTPNQKQVVHAAAAELVAVQMNLVAFENLLKLTIPNDTRLVAALSSPGVTNTNAFAAAVGNGLLAAGF